MHARERLDEYLASLRQRLKWAIVARASAVVAVCVLLLLCAAIVWLAPLGFPTLGVVVSRIVLAVGLLLAGALLFWRPLDRLRARAGAAAFEQQLPEQHGRIETYMELQSRQAIGAGSPMLDLLAEDAFALTNKSPIESVVTPQRLWIASGVAAAALAVLVYLLIFGSAQWGYGSRHLLLGVTLPAEAVPVKQITLHPGNKTLRRNADLMVQARVQGFKPKDVQLFVSFADTESNSKEEWERAAMQPAQAEGQANYLLTLYALRAPLKYYAVADGVRSPEYQVKVVDVPRIDNVQLHFDYPQWTGLPPATESKVRDVRAVEETRVEISARSSEPLDHPMLVFDEAQTTMTAAGNANSNIGAFTVGKPGRYHISSRVAGDLVALTDDYDIVVLKDEPPTIEIVKPGRDWRATSVEEVPVVVRAQDDFRLQQLELRYSVNGGEWRNIKLPANSQHVENKSILQMEELGGKVALVPGDLVTYYAVTKDRKQSAQTDLFLVQVQPFERRFTEGQGGGGAGDGGGSEQEQIADRQREILIATWNLQRARDQQRRTPQQLKESAEMLSGLQDKLAEQTNTLVERTNARTLGSNDARVKQFLESLGLAVKAMAPAATHLNALELQAAVPSEQQALQMLLRAESSFRDIQVSRQQDSQAGGGGSRASRDISELYELEMDLAKNKYETEKELSQDSQAPNQEMDAAVAKLKELAARQEKLAEQQRQQQQPNNADRWKQEQLRREAEELRRQLQEMARQQQAGSQQSGSQPGSQQSGAQQGSQSSASAGEVSNALKALESALQSMRNAEEANKNSRKNANDSAEQASRNLQQAARNIEQSNTQPSASKNVEQLADQAKRIATEQKQIEADIYKAVAGARAQDNQSRARRDGLTPAQAKKLAEDKQQVLTQLQQLENKLRETTQQQRGTAPKTAQRLGEIIDELASANVPSRLSRAIEDLERGRADQEMMGEGLVTEALQNTASDLRDAVRIADQEAKQRADTAQPEALLAELAELRRALQTAQDARARDQQGQPSGQQPGQQSGQQSGQQGQQSGQQPGQQQGAQIGEQRGLRNGPILGGRIGSYAQQQIGDGDPRAVGAIRQQLEAIQGRVANGSITFSDLQALRAVIPKVRYLAGDPLSNNPAFANTLERLELAALAVAEKSRKQAAVRAGTSASSVGSDSETVAEYYRRLAK